MGRWVENPCWQYFCGYEYLQHELSLHPTRLVKWRQRMSDTLEVLLEETIQVAMESKALKRTARKHVNVNPMVQKKSIAFPTDARLYQKMRVALVREAQRRGINLRQSFQRVVKEAAIMQGRYASACQMKRAARQTRKLKTYLGRVTRDIERKADKNDETIQTLLAWSQRILKQQQQQHDKNNLYSEREPDIRCIAKGKAHKRYELEAKVSFVTSSKDGWLLSAQSLKVSPFDGHTLTETLKKTPYLTGATSEFSCCDKGYRVHKLKGKTRTHIVGRISKRTKPSVHRWIKRRAAIEPTMGHLKSDHRLDRNYHKSNVGDEANVILTAAA